MPTSKIGKEVKLIHARTIHMKCTDGVSTVGLRIAEGSVGKVAYHYMAGEVASPVVRLRQPEFALVIDVLCEPYGVEVDE